ncbi:spore coat protein SP96-like [Mytilus edulis]|uniref:spore coat protein SP96-like n=1 Tax=Mytilus edulis TaxID=6550 RepID=UPI0039F00F4C
METGNVSKRQIDLEISLNEKKCLKSQSVQNFLYRKSTYAKVAVYVAGNSRLQTPQHFAALYPSLTTTATATTAIATAASSVSTTTQSVTTTTTSGTGAGPGATTGQTTLPSTNSSELPDMDLFKLSPHQTPQHFAALYPSLTTTATATTAIATAASSVSTTTQSVTTTTTSGTGAGPGATTGQTTLPSTNSSELPDMDLFKLSPHQISRTCQSSKVIRDFFRNL